MTINPMLRTIHKTIAYSPNLKFVGENKKPFQLIQFVTGKRRSVHTDYEIVLGRHNQYDTVTLKGRKGFITVTLEPLFKIEE